jgi:glycosyltransferase involved in cell wall biosynthesis
MTTNRFHGKLGLQQRVLPAYRAGFLDALAEHCEGGLSVFAGEPLPGEGIEPATRLGVAQLTLAKNRSLLKPGSPWFVCWQDGFIPWLEASEPDVLIVEANPRYPETRKAIDWIHKRGRSVIGWGLGAPAIVGPLARLREKQRADFLRALDALVAYSQQGAQQYRQVGIPEGRVYVASNAVAPAPSNPPALRQPHFDAQPSILFVGRLQRRKRLDLLLQACSSLPARLQPRLVIVGDGPAMAELRQLASKVYPQAEFAGARHGAELEPYFEKADLFVLPGTGGLAIQQAMAHGLPVVVARGDGTQEDLVRVDNGWLVPPDDQQALVDVLQQAFSHPSQLLQMGSASFRIVAEEINIEKMVGVFIEVVNSVSPRR